MNVWRNGQWKHKNGKDSGRPWKYKGNIAAYNKESPVRPYPLSNSSGAEEEKYL